jgi:predicted metal-dependent hydrolase
MPNTKLYIDIKDKKIPVIIREYTNSNNLKIYFKGDILNISKPKFVKKSKLLKIIKESQEDIYNQYINIKSVENEYIKRWNTGEKFMYKGKLLDIELLETINKKTSENENQYNQNKNENNKISIQLNEEENKLKITVPEDIDYETKKQNVDKVVNQLLKNNTIAMLQKKLPEISKKIGIKYNGFKVKDAITRYGSCNPKTKNLNFSSRIIMLPEDEIYAIIVHELCHIVQANHSKAFYDLVELYVPNYKEYDKWLKKNAKYLSF